MTDIVERLRDADISGHGSYSALVRDAANEIERLRAALRDRPRDDGTVVAVGGEPGASAGKSE